jgi:hypothetical protein
MRNDATTFGMIEHRAASVRGDESSSLLIR